MTIKEYNEIFCKVKACEIVVDTLDEILQNGDITRLKSLVPDDFTKIVGEALDMYIIHTKLQIKQNMSTLDQLEPFLNWCERTGNEFNSKNYQEYLDQKDISDNVI